MSNEGSTDIVKAHVKVLLDSFSDQLDYSDICLYKLQDLIMSNINDLCDDKNNKLKISIMEISTVKTNVSDYKPYEKGKSHDVDIHVKLRVH